MLFIILQLHVVAIGLFCTCDLGGVYGDCGRLTYDGRFWVFKENRGGFGVWIDLGRGFGDTRLLDFHFRVSFRIDSNYLFLLVVYWISWRLLTGRIALHFFRKLRSRFLEKDTWVVSLLIDVISILLWRLPYRLCSIVSGVHALNLPISLKSPIHVLRFLFLLCWLSVICHLCLLVLDHCESVFEIYFGHILVGERFIVNKRLVLPEGLVDAAVCYEDWVRDVGGLHLLSLVFLHVHFDFGLLGLWLLDLVFEISNLLVHLLLHLLLQNLLLLFNILVLGGSRHLGIFLIFSNSWLWLFTLCFYFLLIHQNWNALASNLDFSYFDQILFWFWWNLRLVLDSGRILSIFRFLRIIILSKWLFHDFFRTAHILLFYYFIWHLFLINLCLFSIHFEFRRHLVRDWRKTLIFDLWWLVFRFWYGFSLDILNLYRLFRHILSRFLININWFIYFLLLFKMHLFDSFRIFNLSHLFL